MNIWCLHKGGLGGCVRVSAGVRRLASGVCGRNMRGNGRRTKQVVTSTGTRGRTVLARTRTRTGHVITRTRGRTTRLGGGARTRLGLFTARSMRTLGDRIMGLVAKGVASSGIGTVISSATFVRGIVLRVTGR